jgi:signal transduction histidine kinase
VIALAGWISAFAASAAAWVVAQRLGYARELAARASHEVRGPLTAAQLALDAMTSRGEVAAERAAALEAQLRRAALAADDLAAAPSRAIAPDRLGPVPVGGLIAQIALAWRPVAAAHGRELVVAGAAPPCLLIAARTRLAQAAGNLIANALEHGSGAIELRPRADGDRLSLEVRDAGPGLPAPVAELVRRPRSGRGSRGRGLAIAAAVAERHGGRLHAAPSPSGASLVLELPIAGPLLASDEVES